MQKQCRELTRMIENILSFFRQKIRPDSAAEFRTSVLCSDKRKQAPKSSALKRSWHEPLYSIDEDYTKGRKAVKLGEPSLAVFGTLLADFSLINWELAVKAAAKTKLGFSPDLAPMALNN
jgi:hypothetical protein